MACFIIGAGDFFGLQTRPQAGDYIIAADGGWRWCVQEGLEPDLLLGDFDSLDKVPDFHTVQQVPVEKDDTDMMLAIKEGLRRGEKEFHLYGGMGGRRTDHTVANLQSLLYLAHRGATGCLYGNGECYTALCGGTLEFPARDGGILSVFCMSGAAEDVSILGGKYVVEHVRLTSDFPLGVSNHFVGGAITVSVGQGDLLISLAEE